VLIKGKNYFFNPADIWTDFLDGPWHGQLEFLIVIITKCSSAPYSAINDTIAHLLSPIYCALNAVRAK